MILDPPPECVSRNKLHHLLNAKQGARRLVRKGDQTMTKKHDITPLISHEKIVSKVHLIRGKKVMLDRDLAALYEVETRTLNQAVKRNLERFPEDFMFQLTPEEAEASRSQIVILKKGQNIKYQPYAFTDYGILMLSSVLNSPRAIQVNIQIMRTYTRMYELAMSHKDLLLKLEQMEKKYDSQFQVVFKAIKALIGEKPKGGSGHKRFGDAT